jgi:iron complex outermembrane receptor protein
MKRLLPLLLLVTSFIAAKSQPLSKISGTVANSKSQPIQGATVYLLNTNYTTTTSSTGSFGINNVTPGDYEMHISAIGYAAVNRKVSVKTGGLTLSIVLNESDIQLSEVVVTAQKTEEDPQKIPFSITQLSAKQVQDARLWDAKDLTAIVPNLYSSNSGDSRNVTGIRGIATTSYDPAVATYIDGVNQYGLDTYIGQLFDVDRIEILRGPQGTLYGRNAMGGVINIITKQPSNVFNGFAGIDIGNYGEQRYTLGIRTPLIKDKLYFGAAGIFSSLDGYYTNEFNNSKFDKQHYFLGNYFLKYLPSAQWTLTANFKNMENRNYGAFPLVASIDEALSKPFTVNQNAVAEMVDNTLQASLTAAYSGEHFTFTSQSSFQENKRTYKSPLDGDFSPLDAVSVINDYGSKYNREQTWIQEFKFTSPAASTSRLKWTAGAYGFYHYSPDKQGTYFGDDAAAVGSPMTDFTSINTNIGHNYGLAGYGQATYTIDQQWDVTAGIRYDYEHKKEMVNGAFQPNGQAPIVTQADTSSTVSYGAFTSKLNVAYHLSANNHLYAAYSSGFRAGGISQLGSDPSQPPLYSYKPEYSNNYEAGSKNSFLDNKLQVNVALFYTLVTDAQVPTLILPDAITVTKNAGRLNSKGAELEVAATLVKGLLINYNFGYTHARYTDLVVSSNGEAVNLKGNHQVFTPDVTSMLALQYGYDLNSAKDLKLVARGEWKYIGDQYFDLANQNEQKAYSLFNARLGVAAKQFNVFLWSSNVGNKHYVDYAYDFGAAHLGNPRTYGVSVGVNF